MKYKTHLAGGVFAGLIVAKLGMETSTYSAQFMGVLGVSAFGSLLPDIDHKGSYLGRRLKPLSSIISKLTNHRGATHTPVYSLAFTLAIYLLSVIFGLNIPVIYFVSLFAGIMSHILLDSLTKGGVPMLAPISQKKISFTDFKTGSYFEVLVLIGLSFTNAYILISNI